MASTRQPAIYLPRGGGPWPYMDDLDSNYAPIREFLEDLPAPLPQRPDAILIVTAHQEADRFTIASARQPELIYP